MRKLLDQLFEFARIEADELVLAEEPVNLGNVLRDTLALFYNDFCSQDSEPESRFLMIPLSSPVMPMPSNGFSATS